MKRGPSGVRVTDPVDSTDLGLWMSIEDELRGAFINAGGPTPARLLAVARILIQLATKMHRVDGGPRFTRPQ